MDKLLRYKWNAFWDNFGEIRVHVASIMYYTITESPGTYGQAENIPCHGCRNEKILMSH